MKIKRISFIVGLTVFGLLQQVSRAQAANFTFTTLDNPSQVHGTFSNGNNDLGDFVGYYEIGETTNWKAYVNKGGTYSDLTLPFPNVNITIGAAINNSGHIAGGYDDGNRHGFFYDGSNYMSLNNPLGIATEALGINNLDQIVGNYVDPNNVTHGFFYDGNNYITLDDPLATQNPSAPLLPSGAIANGTYAFGINDSGNISGYYFDDNFLAHGFIYDKSTNQYNTLDHPEGVNGTDVLGINNSGDAVGYYIDNNGSINGFLYRNGSFDTVNVPGAPTTFAVRINNLGQIVGNYTDASGNSHGYLATPVPEPSNTLALTAGSVFFLGVCSLLKKRKSQQLTNR
jgi:hypothetical protein